MKKEHLPEEEKNTADDLRFMRSTVEKTYRPLKPETHDAIMWGLVCMAAYIGIHFLVKHNLYKWIAPLYLSLMGLGMCGSFVTMFMWVRRQREKGFVPTLPFQLGGIMLVIMFPIIFWDRMGLFENIFCGAGFIYAMGLSMGMGVYGVLYSKAGFLGGIIIFSGMLLAVFAKDYACPLIILGLSTGAGLIIPAIIVQRNYSKQEKSYE
ncbi:MAG: hypothetical protein ABIG61_11670 [Planctomycetota bacterium]